MTPPTLLMAQVTDPFGGVESEPVVVAHPMPGFVCFELDDGTRWLFEVSELRRAVAGDAQQEAA